MRHNSTQIYAKYMKFSCVNRRKIGNDCHINFIFVYYSVLTLQQMSMLFFNSTRKSMEIKIVVVAKKAHEQ